MKAPEPPPPKQQQIAVAETILGEGDTTTASYHESLRPQIEGYEILEELGRGGMSVVYRALQKKLDRIVAVKVLLAGPHADAELLARFRTEAKAVAKLQHPNIVQIYEVGGTEGRPFLSLEFLAGGSLDDRLKNRVLSPRESASLVRTLATAIQAAHDLGIIHRDLKPANILLASDGAPKIADFGVAKQLTDSSHMMTRTGDIIGTPNYMAPEQAGGMSNKTLGPACDIYALGAILYELLSGRPPFRGHDSMEIVRQVISQEPDSLHRLANAPPRDLETICLKCLEKQPQKRYASARDLADDLGRFLERKPIQARPTASWEKAWKWMQRRPALTALIVLSVLSPAAIIVYGAQKNRELARALATTAEARDRAESNLRLAIESTARRISRTGDSTGNPLLEELAFLEEIRNRPAGDDSIQYERALATGWAGFIYSELNDFRSAEKAFAEAIRGLSDLAERFPQEPSYGRDQANFVARYGSFLAKTGDNEGARREFARSVTILEELTERHPQDTSIRILLAAEYTNLGATLRTLGSDSQSYHDRAVRIRRKLVEVNPKSRDAYYDLTVSQINLAAAQMHKERFAEAEKVFRECLQALADAPAQLKAESEYRRTLIKTHLNLAVALQRQNKNEEAEKFNSLGVNDAEKLVELYPQSVPLRQLLIDAHTNYANLLVGSSKYAEAIAQLERVVLIYTQLSKEFPENSRYAEEVDSRQNVLERLKKLAGSGK